MVYFDLVFCDFGALGSKWQRSGCFLSLQDTIKWRKCVKLSLNSKFCYLFFILSSPLESPKANWIFVLAGNMHIRYIEFLHTINSNLMIFFLPYSFSVRMNILTNYEVIVESFYCCSLKIEMFISDKRQINYGWCKLHLFRMRNNGSTQSKLNAL